MAKNNENSTKKKNKKKINPNAISMKAKALKPNPFETIRARRKFDILGKKSKGEELRAGLVRSRAIQKRVKTLLKDYEQSTKSSLFLDKRIGEQNEGLGEFDKAVLRSQRERQLKVGKKSKYNLSDGEEDELDIQDAGLFSGRDDFEDEVPLDDEGDGVPNETEERLAILKQLRGNGSETAYETAYEGEENRQKSKQEVMKELISKSKYYKAQKAKDKEENDKLIEQLDKHFTSLQSEGLISLSQPNKINGLEALMDRSIMNGRAKKSDLSGVQRVAPSEEDKPDAYDKLVNEMVLDMRARPSDRTKTLEEIAQEEKERLEKLEGERQRRMLVVDDSSDEDDQENDNGSSKRLQHTSGDDLGDSFGADEGQGSKMSWIAKILKQENENDIESEDGESSKDDGEEEDNAEEGEDAESEKQSLKDWEMSDGDDTDTDFDEGEGEEDDEVCREVKQRGHRKLLEMDERYADALDPEKTEAIVKLPGHRQGDLPFTIEVPKSLEELTSLLDNRSDYEVVEAIRRIRTFNSIKVAAENRKKMQVFYGVLLQYFAVSANKKPSNMKLLNLLVKPLMEMSSEIPYFAAICARQRLLRIRSQLTEDIKNSEKNCWPSMKTIFLLRLWSMIFPCSDFRHVVMTPAIMLMCEYLMLCPITSGRDVAIGCFISSMVLSLCKQSHKFCPEAIIFLQTLLISALDKKPEAYHDSQFYHLMEFKAPKPLLYPCSGVDEINSLDFLILMDSPEDSHYFSSKNFRTSMLGVVLETLLGFIKLYVEYDSFPEIFLPISKLVAELAAQEHMPNALQDKLRAIAQLIEKKAQLHNKLRLPLQMRKQKPASIVFLSPKFEENFVKGRDYDPDRERAEQRKLRKRLKEEAKGAARELRKDNYYLSGVKEKEKVRLEAERAEKYGIARAFLQEQEHAYKSGQLGRGKKRRR